MAYYLGIDGGGSTTRCAVGDESSLLTTAAAGPSNITRVGEARARESLHEAIRAACVAAKILPRQLQRACIGVAGAGREVRQAGDGGGLRLSTDAIRSCLRTLRPPKNRRNIALETATITMPAHGGIESCSPATSIT